MFKAERVDFPLDERHVIGAKNIQREPRILVIERIEPHHQPKYLSGRKA
jgi:hypothetical protein